MKSLPTFLVALATLVVLVVLAWRNGRTYCNTICPVGTVLGFISRYSLYRVTIDTDKCNSCGLCARQCKAACINSKEHKIDGSRCVACMNCLDTCRKNALTYAPVWKTKKQATGTEKPEPEDKTNLSRRRALSATALVVMGSALKPRRKGGRGYHEERRGTGTYQRTERAGKTDGDCTSRSIEHTEYEATLHGLPALYLCLPESCPASFRRFDDIDAAGDVL